MPNFFVVYLYCLNRMARSSSGLGYGIFIPVTRIRIPHALQFFITAHSSNGEDTAEKAEMVSSIPPWATERAFSRSANSLINR